MRKMYNRSRGRILTADDIIKKHFAEYEKVKYVGDYEYMRAKIRMDTTLRGEVYKNSSYERRRGNISINEIYRRVTYDNDVAIEILTMLIKKRKVRTLYNLLDIIHKNHNKLLMECNLFYKLKWHKRFLNSNVIKKELYLLYKLPLSTDSLNIIKSYILNV